MNNLVKFLIVCVVIILLVAVILCIVRSSKEKYPGILDYKYTFSNFDPLAQTNVMAVFNRYGLMPIVYSPEKFNKTTMFFMYALVASFYIRLYSWKNNCNNNINKKKWMIGQYESIYMPLVTNFYNSIFYYDLKDYLNAKSSGCTYPDTGADGDLQLANRNAQICARFNNNYGQVSEREIRNTLNFFDDVIAGRNRVHKNIWSVIINRTNNLLNTFIDREMRTEKELLTMRNKPFLYKLQDEYPPIALMPDRIIPPPLNFAIPINGLTIGYTLTQILGMCSNMLPVDWFQPIIREAGGVFRNNLPSGGKLGGDYIIVIRGTVFTNEFKYATNFENISFGNQLYQVHKGFYDLYTNKPKFTRDKANPAKDKMLTSYPFVNQPRTYLDEYEAKGSLQEQVRKLLKTEGNQITSLTICGHSLGAGIAQILLADILVNKLLTVNKIKCCYLLNSPRTINVNLMRYLASSLKGQIYDIQNVDDFLTTFPTTHIEPHTERQKIIVDEEESTLVSVNRGFTFCHFDNVVGVQFNMNDLFLNHYAEAIYSGLNSLCNTITSPKTPITQDIQYNLIYQKLYDDGKVNFDNKLDKNRSMFLGTKNLSFWNRSLKTNIMPSLFREITPNKLLVLSKNNGFLLLQSVKILTYNFIKNRLDNPSQNMLEISSYLENNIPISNDSIIRDQETKKYNKLWVLLNKFFSECLDLLSRNSLSIKGSRYGLSDYGINQENLIDLKKLKETIINSENGETVEVLKAVTRTFFLIICPHNMQQLSDKEEMYTMKAIISLLCYLNYLDDNIGYNYTIKNLLTSRFSVIDNDQDKNIVKTLFFIGINLYFSRCGLYYDYIIPNTDNRLSILNYINSSQIYKIRDKIGYDNVDFRTWEFLFGEVAPRYDTSYKYNLRDNLIDFKINPLANFDERSLPTNASEQTKYLYWGGNYKNLTITNSCEEEKTSCCDMTELNYNNNRITNPNPYLKWGKPTGDQYNYPFIFPLPGYDSVRTSDNIKTNSGYLIDRYGQLQYNCFEAYDVNMAENLILMFANKEWFTMNKATTVFSNINKIGNIVYKDELNIVPNDITIKPDNLTRFAADKDKITIDVNNLLIGTVNKITDVSDRNIYMVFLDGENLDQKYLTGLKLFDALIYDFLLSIKSQQLALIQDMVMQVYEKFKGYFWIGAASTLAASAIAGAGLGALIGTIFGGTAAAGAVAGTIASGGLGAIIVGIISYAYIVAENSQGDNYDKAKKLLVALPDLLTETLKEMGLDYLDTTSQPYINSSIGANYATGLVKQIVFKKLDELLGPQFTIFDRKMIEASFASYETVTSQPNPLNIENSDFIGVDEQTKYLIKFLVTNKQNFFSYANLIYSSGSNPVRKQIVNILSNDIKTSNRPYQIFVAGHGMGGALSHCLYLDLILDNLRQNRISSLDSNNFTFYSYGSPRVFNSSIYETLEILNKKPNFYNIINLDDYLTSYPASMLYGILLKQPTIDKMKLEYNVFLTNERYYFSHFPNTFVFNRPMGFNTEVNYVDRYNPSNPNTQYVKKAHCAKTYYYGLRDFHRKLIGNWLCGKDYVATWNYNQQTMPLGLPINPEILCPQGHKKKDIDVGGSKVPGCFADCKTENDCKDKFYTTNERELVNAPYCLDTTCNPCPPGHNLINKNGEYYCMRNCTRNRDPNNPNMECISDPKAYYGKIGELEESKYCDQPDINVTGTCKPAENINCNIDFDCFISKAYNKVNDVKYNSNFCINNKCEVCPQNHNLYISEDNKAICERPCPANGTCQSIGALSGSPYLLKNAPFCDTKTSMCSSTFSCQSSLDCKDAQYITPNNEILSDAKFCNLGTCSVCPLGHELVKNGNDYYCERQCESEFDCKEFTSRQGNTEFRISPLYGKLNNFHNATVCKKKYGENKRICVPEQSYEDLKCENDEKCNNLPVQISAYSEVVSSNGYCKQNRCSLCPPNTNQVRSITTGKSYCSSSCINHLICDDKTFNELGQPQENTKICNRMLFGTFSVCTPDCPLGYELIQEGANKFCKAPCENNGDCSNKKMIDSDASVKNAPICMRHINNNKYCSA